MKKIKKVYIEITNKCNLNCSFCKKSKRDYKDLSVEEFKVIIEKIKPISSSVYFHVLGEPLLHPDVGEFLDICNENKVEASITTNGSLIDKQKENLINKPALRQINYSLHSLIENKGDVDNVLKGIFEFINRTQMEFYHCLRLWNFASSDEAENRLILDKISSYLGEDIVFPKGLTSGHGIKIMQNIYLQQQERFVWPDILGEEIFLEGKCKALRHDIAILSDGSVTPCCLDAEGEMELGNIFHEDLDEILNSHRAKKIYNGFTKGKVVEGFCRTCGFANRNFNK